MAWQAFRPKYFCSSGARPRFWRSSPPRSSRREPRPVRGRRRARCSPLTLRPGGFFPLLIPAAYHAQKTAGRLEKYTHLFLRLFWTSLTPHSKYRSRIAAVQFNAGLLHRPGITITRPIRCQKPRCVVAIKHLSHELLIRQPCNGTAEIEPPRKGLSINTNRTAPLSWGTLSLSSGSPDQALGGF